MILLFPVLILMAVAVSFWSGFALVQLWEWFIVETFGVPKISVPVAAGVVLIAQFLVHQKVKQKDEESGRDYLIRVGAQWTIRPLIYLLIGFIISRFL
jgi:regulator of protease activity HflC (stomatin/prohibitin superfamily)